MVFSGSIPVVFFLYNIICVMAAIVICFVYTVLTVGLTLHACCSYVYHVLIECSCTCVSFFALLGAPYLEQQRTGQAVQACHTVGRQAHNYPKTKGLTVFSSRTSLPYGRSSGSQLPDNQGTYCFFSLMFVICSACSLFSLSRESRSTLAGGEGCVTNLCYDYDLRMSLYLVLVLWSPVSDVIYGLGVRVSMV